MLERYETYIKCAFFVMTIFMCTVLLMKDGYAHDVKEDRYFHSFISLDRQPQAVSVYRDFHVLVALKADKDSDFRIVYIDQQKNLHPFPDASWAVAPNENGIGLEDVTALRATRDGIVWILDNGSFPKRLIGWHFNQKKLHKVIEIDPQLVPQHSDLKDMAVDTLHKVIFIADAGSDQPALVSVSMEDGETKRILEGHVSVIPDLQAPTVINGKDSDLYTGLRSITIDTEYDFLYFGAQNSTLLYRALIEDLLDDTISEVERSDKVQEYAQKPVSAGLSIDAMGNIYIAEVNEPAIGKISIGTKRYKRLYESKIAQTLLQGSDSLNVGTASLMYVTTIKPASTGHHEPSDGSKKYKILRFIAGGPLYSGR